MSRIVYIGGFGNGRHSAERVANSLGDYYEDPVPFTYSEYVRHTEKVQKALEGADLGTHSAGALVLKNVDIKPVRAYLFNAPLPTTVPELVWNAVKKTVRMYTPGVGLHRISDAPEVVRYSASAVSDIVAHPVSNFGINFRGLREISQFDVVAAAIDAKNRGIESELFWTSGDSFYKPLVEDHESLGRFGISSTMLFGEHDELPLRPDALLGQVF